MKILNILGSPQKNGTSARIAQSFVEAAEDNGATVETFYLNGMKYKGCQGCNQCHTKLDHCVIKDELTQVLDAMRDADITVFSSPVYYGDTTGQFKLFLDRTWSHVEVNYENEFPFSSRLPEGKRALFVLTQGDTEDKHGDIVERYSEIFGLYGYDFEVIRAVSLGGGGADVDVSEAQAQAKALAEKFM